METKDVLHQLATMRPEVCHYAEKWRVKDLVTGNKLAQLLSDDGLTLLSLDTNTRWNLEQMSKYIESILLGIPQTNIVLGEVFTDSNGPVLRYLVIDGWCRLQALNWFINYAGILRGLTELSKFNGKTYTELPSATQRILLRAKQPVLVLYDAPSWVYTHLLENKG